MRSIGACATASIVKVTCASSERTTSPIIASRAASLVVGPRFGSSAKRSASLSNRARVSRSIRQPVVP